MTIDGTAWLLAEEENGIEYVQQYSAAELEEVFTREENSQLAAGETVLKLTPHGGVRYTDMVGAARRTRS